MGYMLHHAIVVTSWDVEKIYRAHNAAREFGNLVSDIVAGATNGYLSFFVAPDGSKEGWGASDEGDQRRAAFVNWLDNERDEDGSSSLKWAELVVNGDDDQCYVVTHGAKGEESADEERKRIMTRLVELDALTARNPEETEIELDEREASPACRRTWSLGDER
jgi:hypothetical protein